MVVLCCASPKSCPISLNADDVAYTQSHSDKFKQLPSSIHLS